MYTVLSFVVFGEYVRVDQLVMSDDCFLILGMFDLTF